VNSIDRLHEAHSAPADFAREYVRYLSEVLASIDTAAIGAFAEALLDAREREATVYFIGNGGSAATASHFANDLAIGTRSSGRPFRVVSLVDNVPMLTAVANDFGYAEIFLKQLQVLLRPGDVVVAISASGNSPNLLNAVEFANSIGATTIGLTGFDGGRLREIAHLGVHVPTPAGEYGPVEDAHMVLDHLVGNFLRLACAKETHVR
jgi:D-sedoheptulose 7-phosphate isomerase